MGIGSCWNISSSPYEKLGKISQSNKVKPVRRAWYFKRSNVNKKLWRFLDKLTLLNEIKHLDYISYPRLMEGQCWMCISLIRICYQLLALSHTFWASWFWLLLLCWIYDLTSTNNTAASLLILTWWSCPSARFLKPKLKTSGSRCLSSLYLICKLPKEEKNDILTKIEFYKN